MIVNSNAFVYSTCLLVVVSRYGNNLPILAISANHDVLRNKDFFQNYFYYNSLFPYLYFTSSSFFSSLNPLGKVYKLRGRYFNRKTISLRRGVIPLSLLMPAFSLGLISYNLIITLNAICKA